MLFFHAGPVAVPQPVLRRFPSLVQLGTAPRVLDVGASRSLALCLLSALRANGERHLHPHNPVPTLPQPPEPGAVPSLGLPGPSSMPAGTVPSRCCPLGDVWVSVSGHHRGTLCQRADPLMEGGPCHCTPGPSTGLPGALTSLLPSRIAGSVLPGQ